MEQCYFGSLFHNFSLFTEPEGRISEQLDTFTTHFTMSENLDEMRNSRRDFDHGELNENNLPQDPLFLFKKWLEEAIMGEVEDPNAMTVSTVDSDGMPRSRVVYLRDLVQEGFIFYTNYTSNKGEQIRDYGKVALNFLWTKLDRQVRITGIAQKIPAEMSDEYFAKRPRESQIGAWASPQSKQLSSRQQLLESVAKFEKEFEGKPIPRPPHWGGYVVIPNSIEFWQGRTARLHDRFLFELGKDNWRIIRLAP